MPQLDFITLFPILLGVILLFFGRRIFWLFIGAVAFMLIMSLVPRFVHHHESLIFYIAIGLGLIAAVAGFFLQKIALRLAGFLAGGFLFFNVWEKFGSADALPWWLPFVIGGILGAILLSFLFEWALIVLSSVTGALLIIQSFALSLNLHIALLVVLSLIGIAAQAKMKRGKSRKTRSE